MNPLLLDLPTSFSSDRLLLRCYQPGDGAVYYQMLQENRTHLYEFLPSSVQVVQSVEEVEMRLGISM